MPAGKGFRGQNQRSGQKDSAEKMDGRYPETIRMLVDSYADLTPELQKAARFMVEHPADIGLNSMRAVAREAGVKPATVSRLSKTLGFE